MNGWAWLLAVALPATVVGAVAAVRLVRTLFVAAADEDALPLDEPASARTVLTVCGVAVVGLAAAVQPLLALARAPSSRTEVGELPPHPPLFTRGRLVQLVGLFALAVVATVINYAVVSHVGGPRLLPGGAAAPQLSTT